MYNSEEKARYDHNKSQKRKIALVLFGLLFGFVMFVALLFFLVSNFARLIPKSWENQLANYVKNTYIIEHVDFNKTKEAKIILDNLNSEKIYDVYVVKNSQINAMALPGNIIIVYEGLYDKSNKSELTFVLAHELGHFVNRDHLKSFGRVILMGLTVDSASQDIMTMILAKGLELINLGFSRDAEYKADEFALKLLKEKKLDTSGAKSFMEKLKNAGGVEPFEYFSTHPNTEDRIKKIEMLK